MGKQKEQSWKPTSIVQLLQVSYFSLAILFLCKSVAYNNKKLILLHIHFDQICPNVLILNVHTETKSETTAAITETKTSGALLGTAVV